MILPDVLAWDVLCAKGIGQSELKLITDKRVMTFMLENRVRQC
ncbi:hypothetical protein AM1_3801 [Acaryochloris marina MBIC11017]|uniref:Uncharacterized protein n=1 Tax=Acaryochloris marina (strain MBIC 11017) TaxID=329726 RepID=B0C5R7_ACAM1|nr:hypothetical protein AM1_3801 [Acaryochloris marina MBIC11017]